jgi:hypothetical protein
MITANNTKKTQTRIPRSRGRSVTIPPPPVDEELEETVSTEPPPPPPPTDLEKLKRKTSKKEEEEQEEAPEEQAEETVIYSDRFVLQSEGIEAFRIKNVELPKIIFAQHKNSQSIKEKSTIMVYFYTMPHEKGDTLYPWRKLFEAAKKNAIKFSIKWLDEKGKVESEWTFGGARIQGVDLGSAAYEKPEPSEGAVEFSYQTINIDGIEF